MMLSVYISLVISGGNPKTVPWFPFKTLDRQFPVDFGCTAVFEYSGKISLGIKMKQKIVRQSIGIFLQ